MIDDRILCTACRELDRHGGCLAAREGRRRDVGELYGPADVDRPRRCEFFLPARDAIDQRTGRERFPVLYAEYEAKMQERDGFVRSAAARGIERAKAAMNSNQARERIG